MYVYLRHDPHFWGGVMVRKTPTDHPEEDTLLLFTDNVMFGFAFAKQQALEWVKGVQAGRIQSETDSRSVAHKARVQLGRIHTWKTRVERGDFGDVQSIVSLGMYPAGMYTRSCVKNSSEVVMKTLRTVKVTDGKSTREMEVVRFLGRVKLWDKSRDEYCDYLIDLPDDTDHAVAGAIRGNGLELVYEPEVRQEFPFSRVCVLVYRMENMVLGASVLVSAERTLGVQSAGDLLGAVRRGVTKWMLSSAEGRRAWEYSGEDFNVGDLVSWLGDEDLVDCLLRERVVGLTIEQLDNFNSDWVYDTVLVNAGELESESEEPVESVVPVAGYWVMEGGSDLVKWGKDGDTVEPFVSKEEAVEYAGDLLEEDPGKRIYLLTVFENGQLLTEEVGLGD